MHHLTCFGRYVGPDFEVPTYYSNYQSYESGHPFNNTENWETVPYRADKDIAAGDEINVTFKDCQSQSYEMAYGA